MKRKKTLLAVLVVLTALFVLALPVQAASKYRNTWRLKNGNYYYMDANGNRLRGFHKIGKHYYLFSNTGRQLSSWRKVNGKYYYFSHAKGKRGYAVKNQTINGFRLNSNCEASVPGSKQDKMDLMIQSSAIMDRITKPTMTKYQRLRACFDYIKSFDIRSYRDFYYHQGWEITFAEDIFYRGRGDCFSFGCAFAFLANAVGYKAYAVSSGGHGWAEINGRLYDPNWATASSVDSYFNMDYDLSGYSGRPLYKQNRAYLALI